ncbi:MAG: hypothetical protein AMS17_17125 [Spirochaetes bacterium DG_61]|jgi:uncharacterized protein YqgC (DUF456 family)|nr:MAG: hypothetical protein AMS17_17125 [Spirochaetes bacterium DG_61]
MIVLVILGILSLFAGIIGCVLPILPGPPLAYLSLILLSFARRWTSFSPALLIVMGILTVVVTVLDYILPVIYSKKKGASKAGVWGSVIGMIAGIFLFPPFGMIIGAFVGAVLGELAFSQNRRNALKAGWGVFVGTLFGIAAKLGVSGIIAFYFFRALLERGGT